MCVCVCVCGGGGGLEASFGSTARDLLSLRLFGWRMSYWLQSSRCVRLAKKTKTKKSFFYQFKLAFQRFIIGGGGGGATEADFTVNIYNGIISTGEGWPPTTPLPFRNPPTHPEGSGVTHPW